MPAEILVPARKMYDYEGMPFCEVCTIKSKYLDETTLPEAPRGPGIYCHQCSHKPKDQIYRLVRTLAPEAADGFGTYTYSEVKAIPGEYGVRGKDHRIIAVLPESMNWQMSRNHSGLWGFEPLEPGEEI